MSWNLLTNPVLATLLFSSVVSPVVAFLVSEMRLSRQRRWDRADRHRLAQEQQEAIDRQYLQIHSLHNLVHETKEQAEAAYVEANKVNAWRAEFTEDSNQKQEAVIDKATKLLEVVKDTNQRVREVADHAVPGPPGEKGDPGEKGEKGETGSISGDC